MYKSGTQVKSILDKTWDVLRKYLSEGETREIYIIWKGLSQG